MTRWVAALLLIPALAWGATTWKVVKPQDCTGVGVPSGCCQSNANTSQGTCYVRNSAGIWTQYHVDIFTSASGNTYTVGGDSIAASVFGMTSLVYAYCYGNLAMGLLPQTTVTGGGTAMKLQVFELYAAAIEGGPGLASNNWWFTCDVFGRG